MRRGSAVPILFFLSPYTSRRSLTSVLSSSLHVLDNFNERPINDYGDMTLFLKDMYLQLFSLQIQITGDGGFDMFLNNVFDRYSEVRKHHNLTNKILRSVLGPSRSYIFLPSILPASLLTKALKVAFSVTSKMGVLLCI